MQKNAQTPSSAHLGVLFVSEQRRYSIIDKFGFDATERLGLERLIGRGWVTIRPKVSQPVLGLEILRRPRTSRPGPQSTSESKRSRVNDRQFRCALEQLRTIASGPTMSDVFNSDDTERAIRERIWYFGLDLPAVNSSLRVTADERQVLGEINECVALAVRLLKCTEFVLALKRAYELICAISPSMRTHMRKRATANARILEERCGMCRAAGNIRREVKPKRAKRRRTSRRRSKQYQFV